MKVKIFLGVLLAICALLTLKFTFSSTQVFFKISEIIHIAGIIILIYKLFVHKSCSGTFLSPQFKLRAIVWFTIIFFSNF